MKIRDFIYLDVERVRSFYAQLSKGLPSERSTERSAEFGADASVEGSIFIAKGQGSIDSRYVRTDSETKSLHDHIFEEFLRKIQDENRVRTLPETKFEWKESNFFDGRFYLVRGVVKIIDYHYIVNMLTGLPKLLNLFSRISAGTTPTKKSQQPTDVERQLKTLPIAEIAKLVEQSMHDALRIKVFPFPEQPNHCFFGSASETCFRYQTTSLIGMYGHKIDAGWTCLLQVNKGSKSTFGTPEHQPANESLEANLEFLGDYLANLTSIMQGVTFPNVAAIPIAIFRDIE